MSEEVLFHTCRFSPGNSDLHTLLIASDGRYYTPEAIQTVLDVSLANGVKEIWIGEKGLCSTPAVSAVIREEFKAFGSFILTASHNPGGLEEDFGIKFNGATGGPDDGMYKTMYENSLKIDKYLKCAGLGGTLGGGRRVVVL